MRFDCFLVWKEEHLGEALDMLRHAANFEIVEIARIPVDDVEEIVRKVYSIDTVPWEHLMAKTRYLLEWNITSCTLILVKNYSPEEEMVGDGPFRHIQCRQITALKRAMRNKLNPPLADPTQKIEPLDVGISHQHAVHATDYESQTEFLLKLFGMPPLADFKIHDGKKWHMPYYLHDDDYSEVEVPIERLRFYSFNGDLLPLAESPHYKYCCGDKRPYFSLCHRRSDYQQRYFDIVHGPEAFDYLIENFQSEMRMPDGRPSLPVVRKLNGDRFRILDGNHRAAIMLHRGSKTVKCLLGKRSDIIPIDKVLSSVTAPYIVLRRKEIFPHYDTYSDVDILTSSPKEVESQLLECLQKYCGEDLGRLDVERTEGHVHLDFYSSTSAEKLDLRFDIVSNFDEYKNIRVRPELVAGALASRQQCRTTQINYPNNAYDLAIRYLEFLEFRDENRPSKQKHLETVRAATDLKWVGVVERFVELSA